jgi:hypothetical protein
MANADQEKDIDQKIFDYANLVHDAAVEGITTAAEHTKEGQMVAVRVRDGLGNVRAIVLTGAKANAVAEFASKYGRFARPISGALQMYDLANQLANENVFNGFRSLFSRSPNFNEKKALDMLEEQEKSEYGPKASGQP